MPSFLPDRANVPYPAPLCLQILAGVLLSEGEFMIFVMAICRLKSFLGVLRGIHTQIFKEIPPRVTEEMGYKIKADSHFSQRTRTELHN